MGKKILKFFLIFGRTMAIENLKKHLILSLLVFDFTFWLYIYIYIEPANKRLVQYLVDPKTQFILLYFWLLTMNHKKKI
jgi:hypothetical protein